MYASPNVYDHTTSLIQCSENYTLLTFSALHELMLALKQLMS